MTGSVKNTNAPDPAGLAVAQAAQDVAGEDTVILFGSRARGDHQPGSDIDLLIVKDVPPPKREEVERRDFLHVLPSRQRGGL